VKTTIDLTDLASHTLPGEAFDINVDNIGDLNDVFIDNVYFSTIPGPAGLMLLGLASVLGGGHGRRRITR